MRITISSAALKVVHLKTLKTRLLCSFLTSVYAFSNTRSDSNLVRVEGFSKCHTFASTRSDGGERIGDGNEMVEGIVFDDMCTACAIIK